MGWMLVVTTVAEGMNFSGVAVVSDNSVLFVSVQTHKEWQGTVEKHREGREGSWRLPSEQSN